MEGTIALLFSMLLVAMLYSSVGHGGASGYLAVMSIFEINMLYFRSAALILNLFVAGIAFINFNKGYRLRWKLILPFLLPSIPMAFLGAMIHLNSSTYRLILGLLLFVAVLRLLYRQSQDYDVKPPPSILISAVIGMALGFLSGMIGIGGGIILSPILIFMHWAGVKETGLYSSLFILCNSLAGLAGLGINNLIVPPHFYIWILVVIVGGLIGSLTSVKVLPIRYFKLSLMLVLLFACVKLIIL
ncbi:MAG: sulfite exporter TauE/SafE family protein [Bacteroidota bacterium]